MPMPGMMKWKNVHIDSLPEDGQEVLLAAGGVYYFTIYDAARQVFRLRDEPDSFFAVADRDIYYWLEIDNPPMAQVVSARVSTRDVSQQN